ncbi:signal peptidase II [Buchananella felis]|uniref:signal peptidase II n=1 Tax=Buchananella felis TaxID=3231492 RepID=UPI003527E2DC
MPSNRTALASLTAAGLGVVALDQATKVWAIAALTGRERQALLGQWLGLELHYNPGASFSFGEGATWVFGVLALLTVAVIIRLAPRMTSVRWAVTVGVFLGGAVGNLIDRMFRAPGFLHGHVVDFIAYGNWFIGNVADIALVGAALALAYLSLRGIEPWEVADAAAEPDAATAGPAVADAEADAEDAAEADADETDAYEVAKAEAGAPEAASEEGRQ